MKIKLILLGLGFIGLVAVFALKADDNKDLGRGFYSVQQNANTATFVTTTLGSASTTIATLPLVAVTSTLHLDINVAANAATSTDGAGYVCIGDFKRSSSTIDAVNIIGFSCPTVNETQAPWQVGFVTTTNSVLIQVAGQAANTINWAASINQINVQ